MKKDAVQNERDRISSRKQTASEEGLAGCNGLSVKTLLNAEVLSRQVNLPPETIKFKKLQNSELKKFLMIMTPTTRNTL